MLELRGIGRDAKQAGQHDKGNQARVDRGCRRSDVDRPDSLFHPTSAAKAECEPAIRVTKKSKETYVRTPNLYFVLLCKRRLAILAS